MSASPPFSLEFQRAFVAMRYFLGARGEGLGAPLGASSEAEVTERRLAHPDRQRRAEALAAEMGRVARALETRSHR